MRVAPVGLAPGLTDEQRAGAAQLQSALTHGHPTALAASDLTAHAVRLLAEGAEPAGLIGLLRSYAYENRTRYHESWLGDLWTRAGDASPEHFIARGWDECLEILGRLQEAVRTVSPETDPCRATGEGWVAEEALATGLLCFLLFVDEPVTALRRAACTSGDSDSIACLAGAFAGAYLGADAWPAEWASRIEYRDELLTLGTLWDARPDRSRGPEGRGAAGTGEEVLHPPPVRLLGERTVGRRLPGLPDQAVHTGLHLGPRHLAALHLQQLLAPVAHVDRESARAQQVAGARQQAEQMHGVLPARGTVGADVGVQLAALAVGVPDEGLVDPAEEERVAQRQQLAAGGVGVLDERGVQALQDVRVAAQGQLAEALQFPAELLIGRPSTCVGGFSKRQNKGVGARNTPLRSVSLASVARPKAREPMTQA